MEIKGKKRWLIYIFFDWRDISISSFWWDSVCLNRRNEIINQNKRLVCVFFENFCWWRKEGVWRLFQSPFNPMSRWFSRLWTQIWNCQEGETSQGWMKNGIKHPTSSVNLPSHYAFYKSTIIYWNWSILKRICLTIFGKNPN